MIGVELNNKINFYLTSLLAFFIPIHTKIPPIIIVLLAINWVIIPSNIKLTFRQLKKNYALTSLFALYVFYAIGTFLSDNIQFGFKVLETNLSFFLLPLIYAAYQNNTKNKIEIYLKWFVIGAITYTIICYTYATYAFFKPVYTDLYGVMYDLGFNYFFYSYISLFFHPSYTAMFSVFALFVISVGIQKNKITFNWKILLSILLLVVFVLLLSSKAGWLGLIFLLFYVSWDLIRKKEILKIVYIIVPLSVVFVLLNVIYTPSFSKRIPKIENIKEAINEKDTENKTVTTGGDGNAARVLIWKASLELLSENLLGLGTGDAKEILLNKYKQKGMTTEYKFQLNCHNQYLSTGLSLGVFGLFLFLFALIYPLYQSVNKNYIILGGFIVLVSVNFLFESMLETQKGIVFFCFFYVIICSSYIKAKLE